MPSEREIEIFNAALELPPRSAPRIKGIPITRYCDEHKLSTQDRLTLFIQICQAVQHTDKEAKTVTISIEEGDGNSITRTTRKSGLTPESKLHTRKWIAAQFELALQILEEA